MKFLKILPLFLLLTFIFSCNEDDDSVTPTIRTIPPTIPYLSATFDGIEFKPSRVIDSSLSDTAVVLGSMGNEANIVDDIPVFQLGVSKNITEGNKTYDTLTFTDSTFKSPIIVYLPDTSSFYIIGKGGAVISKNDPINRYIEGTFEGVMYDLNNIFINPIPDSIIVTNGRFGLTY